jgi:hypothetical protein
MRRLVIVLIVASFLGACGSSTKVKPGNASLDRATAASPDVDLRAISAQKSAIAPLASDMMRIENVTVRRFGNGVQQKIRYRTAPGSEPNEMDVQMRAPVDGVPVIEVLQMEQPTESIIRAELASKFPRMIMRTVDVSRSNAYGEYGLAVGQWANGVRCIYAWQWIDKNARTDGEIPFEAASLRLRICLPGVTLDQLAAAADGVRLDLGLRSEGPQTSPKNRPAEVNRSQPPAKRKPTPVSADRLPDSIARFTFQPVVVPQPIAASPEAVLDPTLPVAAIRGPIATATNPAVSR